MDRSSEDAEVIQFPPEKQKAPIRWSSVPVGMLVECELDIDRQEKELMLPQTGTRRAYQRISAKSTLARVYYWNVEYSWWESRSTTIEIDSETVVQPIGFLQEVVEK